MNKNWLYLNSTQWTIVVHSEYAYGTFAIGSNGAVWTTYTDDVYAIRPALYLKNTVKITGGSGTTDSPYQLGM